MNCKLLLLVIFGIATVSFGQAGAKLADLGFLSGCWEMKNESSGLHITEMWMKPSGDAMIGVGRTIKNGKLADYEFLRIVEDASGLAYISRPSSNKEDTSFKMIKSSSNEVVFENPTHDFPQRIIYKLLASDKLTARIEGTMNGKIRGTDFPYTRARCE
jgi:hypothetical protein